jgi:hypothetical protein
MTRDQPPADPVHLVRLDRPGRPAMLALTRASTCATLTAEAARQAGRDGQVTDLGAWAGSATDPGPGILVITALPLTLPA